MPTPVIVDLFLSVDGFAGGDGLPGYFGYFGPDLAAWIAAEQAVPEVVVMGRRTYETFESMPPEAWADGRAHLMGVRKLIASRTLDAIAWPNTELSRDLIGDVRRLRASDGERLRTWGSLSLASQLLAAGLLDRVRLLRFPVIAGELGRQPAFASMTNAELELIEHCVLDGRLVLEEYRPTGAGVPRA